MAAGSYLSANAQKDIFDKELRDAEVLAEKEPYIAAEGLLKSLSDEGLPRDQSYAVVKQLLKQHQVFLRTFQEKVFGLGSADLNQPIKGALVMAASFVCGSAIPIVPYLITKGKPALYLSVALSGMTLFGVGFFKGILAAQSPGRSGFQFFAIAVAAAALGYVIGLLVQQFFPGIQIPS